MYLHWWAIAQPDPTFDAIYAEGTGLQVKNVKCCIANHAAMIYVIRAVTKKVNKTKTQ